MPAGAHATTSMRLVALSGMARVTGIDADGSVHGRAL
jgi:hypothetical protein